MAIREKNSNQLKIQAAAATAVLEGDVITDTPGKESDVVRPWGSFKIVGQFSGRITVKIVKINPQSRLSLQYHSHRDEEWTVLSGRVTATVDDRKSYLNVGDRATAYRTSKHRLESDIGAQLLEVSYGDFDEEDIVRLGDDYGRTTLS